MIKFLMSVCKFNFGSFEEKEFKKFLRMGTILMAILGIYYMMKPLKDSLFNQLVGTEFQPYAKTISVFFIAIAVTLYTKLLDKFPKHKLLCTIPPIFYGTITLAYAAFTWAFQNGFIQKSLFTVILGYIWYCLIESFGSITVALFWSFSTDVTKSESAKQGFPLVYAVGQFGSIITPLVFINLPISLGIRSDALSIFFVSLLTLSIAPLVKNLIKKTPAELLNSESLRIKAAPKKAKAGFIEGLKLLFSHKYLLSILGVNFFFEVMTNIFDFNFKFEVAQVYSGAEFTQYLSRYNSILGTVSFLFLILGVNKITKRMGLKTSLSSIPVFFGIAITGFFLLTINSSISSNKLNFLFCLMVSCKAIHYSLNGPSLKQLYIPTSPDVRTKSQAWIETFGARLSKEGGAGVNMLMKPLGVASYRLLSSGIGYVFVTAWFFVALYLGKTHKKAIDSNTNVC